MSLVLRVFWSTPPLDISSVGHGLTGSAQRAIDVPPDAVLLIEANLSSRRKVSHKLTVAIGLIVQGLRSPG